VASARAEDDGHDGVWELVFLGKQVVAVDDEEADPQTGVFLIAREMAQAFGGDERDWRGFNTTDPRRLFCWGFHRSGLCVPRPRHTARRQEERLAIQVLYRRASAACASSTQPVAPISSNIARARSMRA
jgi:hypothetical protein